MTVEQLLFSKEYPAGIEYCYLVKPIGTSTASLGVDPELTPDEQVLKEIDWKSMSSMKDDIQVKKVIEALSISI